MSGHPKLSRYDVVINEIMADPSPPVGLPDFEYVEIFNTTNRYINMRGWTFHVGTVEKPVPDLIMQPGEHILFVPNSALWIFQMFGRTFWFFESRTDQLGCNTFTAE
jgi:hypothetical protein